MNTVYSYVFEQHLWSSFYPMIALVGMLIGGAVLYDRRASVKRFLEHRREVRRQRGELMGKKKKAAREAYLKGRWCDCITEFGENEFLEGRMTREEVNAFYRAIGKTHYMPDLVPVMTPSQLKKVIKHRRAHGIPSPAQEHPAWGDHPSETNVIDAKKRFGAKALNLLKKTA